MGRIDAFMDNSVEKRLKYLDNLVTYTSYSRRKYAIEKKFEKCLINLNPVKESVDGYSSRCSTVFGSEGRQGKDPKS